MSEAIDDPYAYTRLTDNVYQQILASEDDNFKEVHVECFVSPLLPRHT